MPTNVSVMLNPSSAKEKKKRKKEGAGEDFIKLFLI